ncbi:MAG TPA: DEAD/DEAH box helicase family protein [Kiritimatiellia bacterium]|nr:DEAD/DEAH box helicase family protein [Kiritimatiellia bacterium]
MLYESRAELPQVNRRSPPDAKIALFRSLFRGREDVYARRFESARSGRSGYQPACAHEWARGLCEKPKVRCAVCEHRRFLPVTDSVIRAHLSGRDEQGRPFVMGLYPLLVDEHCWLVAADFDKAAWREDIRALAKTCADIGVPCLVERSRSGNGAHAWWFFAEPVPARLARDFASWLITETLDRRPEIGLDSYDRLFPNQDTMPKGGFGNLIALPLQKQARANGNSLFLDDAGEPCPDPWAVLSRVKRLTRAEIESRVALARQRRRIVAALPVSQDEDEAERLWDLDVTPQSERAHDPEPAPTEIRVVFSDRLYLDRRDLSAGMLSSVRKLAAFQNPEFYRAQRMRLSTYGKPRVICCAEETPGTLALPRGCYDALCAWSTAQGVRLNVIDRREAGCPLEVSFHGELRPEQVPAGKALLAHDIGVLSAGTAFGKTVLAAWLIAQRRVSTLVLVHRQHLQAQWVARLALFLDLPEKEIGRIGSGHRTWTGRLDVALMQSVSRKGVVDDRVATYGQVIVDECHAVSAPTFERVVSKAKARYVVGLSATPIRKDGHHPIIFMQCGPVRHRVHGRELSRVMPFEHIVQVRPTAFHVSVGLMEQSGDVPPFHAVCDELCADAGRNRLILEDVLRVVSEGRSPVVLTERREHLAFFAEALNGRVQHVVALRGGLGRRQATALRERLAAIPDNEARVLLATGSYLGEGFDDARLDTLLLAMPISWRGRIVQYAGRLHRRHADKHEVRVIDYADLNVPMLARMFERRCRGYEAIGYRIVLPLSATPGWPAEVAVPVEPAWQETYAASIRRLCRDGVDAPLADLFVHAAWRAIPDDVRGAARARSATEAFLFRRLETLEATCGLFALNTRLQIPWQGGSEMEVDLCAERLRLVIELDGAQHLGDSEAYRRDRAKDLRLQEHGFMVVRILAEDVCERLDVVLDTVLRAVAHCRQREGASGYPIV